jgi:glycyl-tRNA synthetase beta chain
VEKQVRISLKEIIGKSIESLKEKSELPLKEVGESVLEFFRQRFQNLLISKGTPHDAVEAVLGVDFDDVADCQERIAALVEVRKAKEFLPLAVAFKRVVNISRDHTFREIIPSLFREDAEKRLYGSFLEISERVGHLLRARDYRQALVELTHLKEPVDRFFDHVLVMEKDRKIRDNRLALLGLIADLFSQIADFSKISTE